MPAIISFSYLTAILQPALQDYLGSHMIYGITGALPGPGLDSRQTFIGAPHRQVVASVKFPGKRVGAGADRVPAAVNVQRVPDNQRLGLPFGDQCADPLPVGTVVAYLDDFQRRCGVSQRLAHCHTDSFCAEVEA